MKRGTYVRKKPRAKVGRVVSFAIEGGRVRVRWLDEYAWPRVPVITRERPEDLEVVV